MTKNLVTKQTKQLEGFAWAIKQHAQNQPPPVGETWEDNISAKAEKIANTEADMADYEPDDPNPPDPDEPYEPPYTEVERDEVLAMPVWDENRIHYMALPGYIYRFLRDDPEATKDKVYELVRQARIAGCKYVRTFLINGSRKDTERYIMDALPWEMVKVQQDGKQLKKIDYTKRNDYYFECCGVIEEACKYWKVHHQPTFWMDRYNEDVFDVRFNMQGVNGYRSDDALAIKCQFIYDYLAFQHNYRADDYKHCWEIENEPTHANHTEGGVIADQNLVMFRAAERHGTRINETMTCSGGTEFSHANFVEEDCDTFNRCFGSDEFASRLVKPEWHSVSTLDDLLYKMNWGAALGSGWKHLCNNEDGANSGSYSPIPWTPYCQANYEELVETCIVAIQSSAEKGKRWIFTLFAMDCLEIDPDDGIAKETYNLARMDWHRYHALRDVRLDLADS